LAQVQEIVGLAVTQVDVWGGSRKGSMGAYWLLGDGGIVYVFVITDSDGDVMIEVMGLMIQTSGMLV
jgi:hypothetical protein